MNYTSYAPRRFTLPPPNSPTPKGLRRFTLRWLLYLGAIVVGCLGIMNLLHLHPTVAAKAYTKPQTVCLDPGHGGTDPGAPSNDGTISERDINLVVAQQVEKNLEAAGYRVYMTRTNNNQTLSNHDRYTYCNQQHATIMVSIHHNDFEDSSVDYATALFYKDQDQALATSILNSVATKLHIQNDGIAKFDDGVLSESTMPAALSEGFFITSDDEYNKLTAAGSTRLRDEADAITAGIINYFTEPASKRSAINSNPQVIEREDDGSQ